MTLEWDARTYHTLAEPHEQWGKGVLERLPLRGDETVLDAGCGTAKVTHMLAERVPKGRVYGVDQSPAMLEQAKTNLAAFGDRIRLIQGDLVTVQIPEQVDAILSTATFHWIKDHDALFRNLASILKPGGRLASDCGGYGQIEYVLDLANTVIGREPYASVSGPVDKGSNFQDAESTKERLLNAGFSVADVWLTPYDATFPSPQAFGAYIRTIVCRHHFAAVPEHLRDQYEVDIIAEAAKRGGRYEVDYIRLNIAAVR